MTSPRSGSTLHLAKYLREAAQHVAGQARRLGWETLLLVGDPRDTAVLGEALPAGPEIVHMDAVLDPALSPSEVLEFVRPAREEARARHDAALAARARGLALSGGNGAVGLDDILSLLRQGRVEHLLLDEAGPRNTEPVGVTPEELEEEMIELTFEHGGEVTVLETGAAEELAEAGRSGRDAALVRPTQVDAGSAVLRRAQGPASGRTDRSRVTRRTAAPHRYASTPPHGRPVGPW
ncbi:hypothetical protein AB0K12_20390 [Nonomuraea sp. NPDC049419]|uniref:hypothetical protein n=1 Tax=Nonomuraea sp. NPDC049419 TaxID=3155772 RepID=UPI003435D1FA